MNRAPWVCRSAAIISAALLVAAVAPSTEATLADVYRSGRMALRADEDWTANLPSDLVFESRGDIAVAPDGSVFVSNTTRHTIYKFGPDGRFVRRFGREGQGPGDLTFPGRLSVLDGKYLVVGEYATNQRLSLFDLDGRFVKVVSTGRFTSKAIALGDSKIAYVSTGGRMDTSEMINKDEVWVIDWRSGAQTSVVKHEFRIPIARLPGGGITLTGAEATLLARTRDGGLIVGTTGTPDLEIYTADGKKVRTVATGLKGVPVTAKYRDRYRDKVLAEAAAEGQKLLPSQIPPLPEVLGILQDVWTDDQGNILACRKTDCLDACALLFKVYSPDGAPLCEFELQPGPFVVSADHRFKRIVLTGRAIYGLLELKDDPDGFLHLVRTVLPEAHPGRRSTGR